MVQFVNIREFKTKTEAVLRRLDQSDVILTVRGKPKAVLRKISERDLALEEEFAPKEWKKLQMLAKEPGTVYKTATGMKRHLRRLAR
ncbi:MAG: type II toxin-antitoxin system prevent-host-death family antitoxin [Candidatus Omnitrophica bacterium]|nr:type II toxin-antitoxin system prevent-host-death family antitoxin [Candidatus Omnitrophota bacterium]